MCGTPVDRQSSAEFRVVVASQHEVLRDAQSSDETLTLAIFGDVSHSLHMPLARIIARHVIAGHGDRSTRGSAQARDRINQFGLSISLHTRDTHDLPGAHDEGDSVDDGTTIGVDDLEVVHRQHHLARLAIGLVGDQLHGSPDHHLGDLRFRGRLREHLSDHLAATQHADPIRDGECFLQLVGDEHHTATRCDQRAHDGKEFNDLLGREDGGRLVEDDDLGIAQQDLHDFHALLHPDGHLFDHGVRVELEAVAVGDLAHHLARLVDVE